jgi:hypothetical protein
MSDTQTYDDFREEIVARYPNTALIAEVSQPIPHAPRVYGPFTNGEDAMEWLRKQVPMNVRVRFVPLRNPNIKRKYEDFYNPDKMLDLDTEYVTSPQATEGSHDA